MTTPGGVPNLPAGALTLDNLASTTQDMTVTAMRQRAVDRIPSTFDTSTGGNASNDSSPLGFLTQLFAGFNSVVANADPANIQGPEDLPALLTSFIESLPVIGQFVTLGEAVLGTYTGSDPTLLAMQTALETARTDAENAWTALQNFFTSGDWNDLSEAYQDLIAWLTGSGTTTGVLSETPGTSVTNTTQNLQPVSDFPNATSVSGGSGWVWDGTTTYTDPNPPHAVSYSLKVALDGTLKAAHGVVAKVQPNQVVTPKAMVKWAGLASTAGTSPIQLQIVPGFVAPFSTKFVAASPVVMASIASPANMADWTVLTGSYPVPNDGSVNAVQMRLVVTTDATAGSVWWAACTDGVSGGFLAELQSGIGDLQTEAGERQAATATLGQALWTIATTPGQSAEDAIAAADTAFENYWATNEQIDSAQRVTLSQLLSAWLGISNGSMDLGTVGGLQDILNQITSAMAGDTANSGPFAWLAQIVNGYYALTGQAHSMAVDSKNTLNIRNNKPLVYGLDNTTESNIPFTSATTAIPIQVGQSVFVPVRCAQTDTKNTIAFIASLPSTHVASAAYVNLWKFDPVAGKLNRVATSSNFVALLSTTPTWIFLSANATPVLPGDVLFAEFNADGGGVSGWYFYVMGSVGSSTIPVHPAAIIPGTVASWSGATTPPSSPAVTQINMSSLTFSQGATPYIGLETSNPPPPVYPDHQETFTSTRTYMPDSWANTIDIVGCGQGGGGQGETGGTVGRGGSPGVWGGKTLTVGTDIQAGTPITCTVQPPPSNRGTSDPGSGGAYFGNGQNGAATVFTWTKPDGTTGTMTCAGGQGGGLGNNNNLTSYGQGPGNFTFNGYSYTGGANVLTTTDGYTPGSSGPGGQAFQYGFNGGLGQGWLVEHQ